MADVPGEIYSSGTSNAANKADLTSTTQTVGMLQLNLWDGANYVDVIADPTGNGLQVGDFLVPHVDWLETNILDLLQASDLITSTTDPLVAGRIWHNSGTVRISLGPDPYSASIDFSLLANSGYIALIEDI